MMTRRELIVAIGAGTLAAPLAAFAQQPGKVWRIGFLQPFSDPEPRSDYVQALREAGYIEGKTLVIEFRTAAGELKVLPALAAELVQLKVDAIVTNGTPSTIAAQKATTTIPIVLMNVADPVASGIVKELSRPGGNVTGVTNLTGDLGPKNLEALLSCVPKLRRIAVLFDPANHGSVVIKNGIEGVGKKAGVTILTVRASNPQEVEDAFASMKQQNAEALLVSGGGFFTQHIQRIVELAIKHRLPPASTNPPHVQSGALVNYSPSRADTARRAVYYLDRILKGAKPGDLPIEQPTKFELVINLKTAKLLGLMIPPEVLVRADRVIE